MKLFGIIHKPTKAIEEFREATDAAGALAGFLEVPSYVPVDYEAQDATGVNPMIRHKWDGTSFTPNPPTEDELKEESLNTARPEVTALIEEVAIIKGVPIAAFRTMLKARMK